ncbi:hypothetical protein CAPTEDRAFT_118307, partial [Capitella teleta]
PKGKQGTKGQKQIVEENKSTIRFYKTIIVAVNVIFLLFTFIFFWGSFTAWYMFLTFVCLVIYFACLRTMQSMAGASYTPDGVTLLDGGIDLNMESGMAEHLKDLILLTAGVQILSLFSSYFWLLLLLAPSWGFYLLWVNFLAPWFFAEAPEVDEKKQKKMERKMKRRQ